MMPCQLQLNQQKGFTLIESIITIVIVGIVASIVSIIIGNYLENYDATSRRTMMQTSAQLAVERISREIRHALPNSICVYNGATCVSTPQNKVYFVTVKDAGYYQDTTGNYPSISKKALPITPVSDNEFDIISEIDEANLNAIEDTDWVAVYNINNSSIYSGNNARKINTLTNIVPAPGEQIVRVQLDSNFSFPLHSPQRRVHIVEPHSTMFFLQGTDLMWGKSADDFVNPATAAESHLLLQNVIGLAFSFTPGSSQRSGLLHIDLTVEDEGEQIHIIHEAHVYNVP